MNRRNLLKTVGGLATAGLLAGCSGEADESTTTTTTTTDTTTTDTTTTTTMEPTTTTTLATTANDGEHHATATYSTKTTQMATTTAAKASDSYTVDDMVASVNANSSAELTNPEWASDSIQVTHVTSATTQGDLASEIGAVAGGYAAYVSHHDGVGVWKLHVTVKNTSGAVIGSYDVLTNDAKDYMNGQISGKEFVRYVLDSIKTEGQ